MNHVDRVMLSKAMVPDGGRETGRMEEGLSSNSMFGTRSADLPSSQIWR